VRPPGGWGRRAAKPANEVITDLSTAKPATPVIPDLPDPENPAAKGKATSKPANEVITDSEVITDPNPLQRDEVGASSSGVMGLSDAKLGGTKQAELILSLAKKYQHPLAERLAQVHLHAKSALSGDNNLLCQAAWMMAGGESPVADQIEPVFAEECYELIDRAKERWKNPQPIPGWCCDGIHCAGDDVRFAGVWHHMYAICKVFEHYGRVDPNDQWLPDFQCYDGLIMEKAGEVLSTTTSEAGSSASGAEDDCGN
jgi:hypothetical protein